MNTKNFLIIFFILSSFITLSLQDCTTDTTCATCKAPPDDTKCLTCTPDTLYVNTAGTKCEACSTVISNCQSCTNTAGATTCTGGCSGTGNYLNAAKTACATCGNTITSCTTCASAPSTFETTCLKCGATDNAKVPAADLKTCVDCGTKIDSCATCDVSAQGATTCLKCTDASAKVPATNKGSCVTCTEVIADCDSCKVDNTGVSTCLKCTAASSKVPATNKGSCVACTEVIADCDTCKVDSAGGSTCLKCTAASSKVPATDLGSCVACNVRIPDCTATGCAVDATTGATTCTTCAANKYQNDALTTCSDCGTVIPSCTACASDGTTHKTTCTLCAADFSTVPADDKKSCVACATKFPGCTKCNVASGAATCATCGSGYFGTGSCTACIEGCDVCSDATTCTTCKNGNTISADKKACTASIPNCVTYATADANGISACTACAAGYGLTSKGACLQCSTGCKTCSFNDKFVETCTACTDNNYALVGSACSSCKSLNAQCQTCTYDATTKAATCVTCSEGNFLKSAGVCKDCSDATDGVPGCKTCTATAGSPTCTACDAGYTGTAACTPCTSNCAACAPKYYFDSTAKTCTQCSVDKCTSCPTSATTCAGCSEGFPSTTSGVTTCGGSCSTDCTACSAATVCTDCADTKYMLIKSATDVTCAADCTTTDNKYVKDATAMTCTACSMVTALTSDCDTCSSATKCLSCLNSKVLYADGSACTACGATGESKTTTTPVVCNQQPTITLTATKDITFDANSKVPAITASCAFNSVVYYAYYLGSSLDSLTWTDLLAKVNNANTTAAVVAPTDMTNTWAGYGVVPGVGATAMNLNIARPLKNSGEVYKLLAYCVSYAGGLTSKGNTSWTQATNGGKTQVLTLVSKTTLDRAGKKTFGVIVKKTLGLNRDMYTDAGDIVTPEVKRDLAETNATNTTNTTQTLNYYVVPDYTLTTETINSFVSTALATPATFLASLKTNIGTASYSIDSVALGTAIDAQPTPTVTLGTPTASDTTLNVTITISNTDGIVYVGVGKAKTSRILADNATNATNATTTTTTVTQTAPSITQLLDSKDSTNTTLPGALKTSSVTKGTAYTAQFTGLTANTKYNIYYAAANQNMPPLYSAVALVTTNTTGAGSSTGGGNTGSEKLMTGLAFILMAFLAMILG